MTEYEAYQEHIRYTHDTSFEELTPTLLREFVEKIVVHECSYDENKTRRQDIEIYYSFVGKHLPLQLLFPVQRLFHLDCRSLPTATFSENRNQLFYKRLPDCPHLLLPLFREIYNQLFHKRLRAGVLPLLPTTPQKAKMTDFPARTFPAARSFPTIRRFGSCVLPAV